MKGANYFSFIFLIFFISFALSESVPGKLIFFNIFFVKINKLKYKCYLLKSLIVLFFFLNNIVCIIKMIIIQNMSYFNLFCIF